MVGSAGIPATMKAAMVLKNGSPLEFRDVPVPQPGNGEVLIKIECTGVCHTDIHVVDGDWGIEGPLPMTPGHEGVGKVVAVGSGVTGLQIGDRVCTPWLHSSCQRCEQCWSGWETVCGKMKCTGFTAHGSFAEYVKAPADFVGRVPDALTNEQAAPIACAGVTVYKGLKESAVKPGQWVVIAGAAGGLGHVGVQYAKAMGMKVVGVDAGAEKIPFLKDLGCDIALDAAKCNVVDEVVKGTGGGAHGALILIPRQQAIPDAVSYVRPRGVVVPIALPSNEFAVNTVSLVTRAVTIKGSIVGNRLDLQEALSWAAEGKVSCNVEVRKFSEMNAILDELRSGKVKGRIVVSM